MRGAHPNAYYDRVFTEEEIQQKVHRSFVGGMWKELGELQFDFILERGLLPEHRFLDVGCGALRGGIHFIRYLDIGHYYGIDINKSLIEIAREVELVDAGLSWKEPSLLVDEQFDFARFGVKFDFALAQSVFTHLPVNSIELCLINIATVLRPGARLFATYFEAPTLHYWMPLKHQPGDVVTFLDRDPFHYHFTTFEYIIRSLPLNVGNIGPWNHPRDQHMLEFQRL